MSKILDTVEGRLGKVAKWLNWCAAGALLVMMALVNANVFLRPLGQAIWGTFEIVGFLGTVVISFALIQTTFSRGHMAVVIVLSRFPQRLQSVLSLFNRLVVLLILVLVFWQSLRYGIQIWQSGQVSPTLKVPFHPFLYGIALAFGIAALVVLVDILKTPFRAEAK
jgi:TRAP-type C4-dicarboxylate transport system permease small subunit